MAKEKSKTGIPNKHLHARIAYLQRAATYLTTHAQSSPALGKTSSHIMKHDGASPKLHEASDDLLTINAISSETAKKNTRQMDEMTFTPPSSGGLPMLLSSHMTQVARKCQIRLHSSVKHQMCKRCNAVLTPETSIRRVENLSKAGRKPHADVLVVECGTCRAKKRFPVGTTRQKKKGVRKGKSG